MYYATQNCLTEWSFVSSKAYRDPFNEVTLDVMFTDPNGEEHQVPAFWSGEQTWRLRYTSGSNQIAVIWHPKRNTLIITRRF